jgi:hypothetical protein
MYRCKKCSKAVIVLAKEKPIKVCDCVAPIVIDLRAEARGKGGVKS